MINETINIQQEFEKLLKQQINSAIKNLDIGSILIQRLDHYIAERAEQGKFKERLIDHSQINWEGFSLSMNKLSSGSVKKFNSTGIQDIATDVNLTVADGQVIIEGETVSKNLTVVDTATVADLTVQKNLKIQGAVTFQNSDFAQQINSLIDTRISQHQQTKTIDLEGQDLISNNQLLINHKELGPSVINSNLRSVGRLTEITVAGRSELAETVYVENNRIGVNTEEPAGVFTAWDEEAEITIKKYRNRSMYIGSTRGCNLVLGVNSDCSLAVTDKGIETNSIKLGNITVSSATKQPEHTGSPGDIVFNEKSEKGQPWAWRCRGNKTWVGLYQ